MKKLLIATMAAVSVGLYAKATDTGFTENGTSFDDLTTGANFESDDNYWKFSDDDTGNEYKIIDVVYPDGAVKKHWDWDQGGEKALAIDTSAPLLRNANAVPLDSNDNPAQDVTTPVFFDSVVQFTATDVKPIEDGQTGNGTDKLMVWLYQSPENLDEGLFDETESISRVVVTAGRIETENGVTSVKVKNYLTDISVNPDTWHRLTIKSFINMDSASEFWGQLMFEVRVDGNKVTVDEKEIVFLSLLPASTDTLNLQGVAFDGKGVVDDIVFTTTDPFYVPPEEAEKVNVSVSINDFDAAITAAMFNGVQVDSGSVTIECDKDSTNTLMFMLNNDYELVSSSPEASFDDQIGIYTITVVPDSDMTVTIVVQPIAGGGEGGGGDEPEVPAKPTVGGVEIVVDATTGKITNITTADNGKPVVGELDTTKFAEYYTVSVTDGVLSIALNPAVATPEINETATDKDDAFTVTDTAVALGVTNAKPGLWYGAQAYSDVACADDDKIGAVTGWVKATTTTVSVTAVKPDAGTAFFKVVVDDQDHTPPAEQE